MQLIYTYPQICRRFKQAAKSLFGGLFGLAWTTILLAVNSAVRAYEKLISAIRVYPCVATAATFLLMLTVAIVVHMQMKVKLTTAEWQRDSLRMKIDSLSTFDKTKTSYFRYKN